MSESQITVAVVAYVIGFATGAALGAAMVLRHANRDLVAVIKFLDQAGARLFRHLNEPPH